MKKVLSLITILTCAISFAQITPSNVTLPITNIEMEQGSNKHLTWNTSTYGNGFGHRIINTDPGGLTLLNFQSRNNSATWSTSMSISSLGDIGIGITNPTTKFQVQDGIDMKISMGALNTGVNSTSSEEPVIQLNRFSGAPGLYVSNGIETLRVNNSTNDYGLAFTRTPLHNENDYSNSFVSMYINNNDGNVGIGLTNPSEKLTVKGKILCEEVEVVLDASAPDYVFQKYYTGFSSLKEDYKMPTLEEVEAFVKENHHLPEVPSAAEIKEEGMQLKEMTTMLLQKVEELTLYTIEQEKRIKTLEAKLVVKQ